MRVTAAIFLILAAILNLFGSLGYLGGGAMTSGMDEISVAIMDEAAKQNPGQITEEQRAEFESQMSAGAAAMEGAGGALLGLGVFLLISVGVLITGAVFLFKGTNWKFVLAAGIVALAAEVGGILMLAFGFMNLPGLVGGVLAIIAALSMSKAAAPALT